MTDDDADDLTRDPGWHFDPRVLLVVLPVLLPWQLRRRRGETLTNLRNVFTHFVIALLIFALVVTAMPARQHGSALAWTLALLGIAAVEIVVPRALERPLDCSSDAALAETFRIRFFLRVAFAESIALFAFVFRFIGGPSWIYDLGAAIAILRLLSQAPTPAALQRDQDDLVARGCGRSLVAALRRSPPK